MYSSLPVSETKPSLFVIQDADILAGTFQKNRAPTAGELAPEINGIKIYTNIL